MVHVPRGRFSATLRRAGRGAVVVHRSPLLAPRSAGGGEALYRSPELGQFDAASAAPTPELRRPGAADAAAAMQSAQTALPAYLLESSPVAPGLHAELTSILEAHPEVAKQLSRTASAGAPLLRKLPISEFLVAAYGEPAVNTGTYVNADGITRTEFTAGAVPIVKLLDVRSPGEFARGHLPGAVNIPLFEDHERAEVGTLFAEKGQEYATSHGLALVGPKLRMYVEFARKAEEESSQVLVYCWRGGQRSASVGWLLSRCGSCASVNTLSGGYRAFRRWAIELVGEDSGTYIPPAHTFHTPHAETDGWKL
jgi:rhodanese-related sulfurtransferase